ncbi:MAG TPA: nuclear transport factor 2 family protein [Caulobacteraceae bacterium]|nr:nuclear transport factor 2 family protein [Caulobacteraceae bacterium]
MTKIKVLVFGLLVSLPAAPAFASDKDDAMAAVQKYLASFNTGDRAAAAALCAPDAIVIDDFPPYAWQGPNTCTTWWDALGGYNQAQGIGLPSDVKQSGAAWQLSVTGDRAYIVLPVTYDYAQHGKAVVEAGSIWTIALEKTASGWLIAGWS